MALHIADHHIHTVPLGLMRRLQHGIGLSHPGSVPEKDFQLTAALLLLLLVQGVQQILRIRPLFSDSHFLTSNPIMQTAVNSLNSNIIAENSFPLCKKHRSYIKIA